MGSRYGLEIRAATAADAPGLSVLLGGAGHTLPAPMLAERLAALRQDAGAALIAAEWGPPSGIVLVHWYRDLVQAQPVALITTLLVGADDRRRGIGRLLVKSAAQAARVAGCGALELLVGAGQPELEAFCAATGFLADGTRHRRALRKRN